MTPAEELQVLRARLSQAGAALAERPARERAKSLEAGCALLLDAESGLGCELRQKLAQSTGLSAPVIELGLETTLPLFTRDSLLSLLDSARPSRGDGDARPPSAPVVVVLAGNVFSAAARPLLFPLLCGRAVLAKASSEEDVFPRLLQRALAAVDPALAQACAVVTFGRQDEAAERILSAGARVISVYGDDETIAGFAARLAPGARLLAHGHGFGAAFVAKSSLGSSNRASTAASALAYDVLAYDQRGCLSPQAVLVERGGAVDTAGFATLLHEVLEAATELWPVGDVPAHAKAELLQWRGVAAALGTLHAGPSSAVSYEGARALRPSPGYRHVTVYDCADLAQLRARAQKLGPRLKALGVSERALVAELGELAPYVSQLGAMQTPPLGAHLDGLHPLEGLLERD
jgi:hypothetical protein